MSQLHACLTSANQATQTIEHYLAQYDTLSMGERFQQAVSLFDQIKGFFDQHRSLVESACHQQPQLTEQVRQYAASHGDLTSRYDHLVMLHIDDSQLAYKQRLQRFRELFSEFTGPDYQQLLSRLGQLPSHTAR